MVDLLTHRKIFYEKQTAAMINNNIKGLYFGIGI